MNTAGTRHAIACVANTYEDTTTVSLETLMREADVVTVHASADRNSLPLLDQAHPALIKHRAALGNTDRGTLIDQQCIADMLTSGQLPAAGLDVFHPQPPSPEEHLLQIPNLFAIRHSAAWVPHVGTAFQEIMDIDNATALLSGQHSVSIVNPQALDNLRLSILPVR